MSVYNCTIEWNGADRVDSDEGEAKSSDDEIEIIEETKVLSVFCRGDCPGQGCGSGSEK